MYATARIIFLFAICAGVLTFSPPLAAAENHAGLWLQLRTAGPFNRGAEPGPWRYRLLGQFRYYDYAADIRRLVLRPSVSYRFNSRFSAAAGYDFHRAWLDGVANGFDEHRTWQQLDWNALNWSRSAIKFRTRLEQRFPAGLEGTGVRLRQRAQLLTRMGREFEWMTVLALEAFVNLRSTPWKTRGYDQTRIFAGFGLDMNSYTVETGYLYQHNRLQRLPDQVNHLLVVSLGF